MYTSMLPQHGPQSFYRPTLPKSNDTHTHMYSTAVHNTFTPSLSPLTPLPPSSHPLFHTLSLFSPSIPSLGRYAVIVNMFGL